MKIGIIGSDRDVLLVSLALAGLGHEVITLTEDDIEESKETERNIIAYCGHPLANVGVDIYPEKAKEYIDNTFRGGSRGKGGKVKYRRS